MKNWNRILNLSIVLHTLIRSDINKLGYVNALKTISKNIFSVSGAVCLFKPLSLKKIRKIIEFIVEKDFANELVTSCMSISLLAHLLCLMSKIDSKIVIGVSLINSKVFSHAWVETGIDKIDFMSEGYDYKPIKKFDFHEISN